MNRREFIKASIPAAAIPAVVITCKYEDDEKGPEKESKNCDWPYRVYCYERGQGEWTFSTNIRGSFAPEREYMTFEEEAALPVSDTEDFGTHRLVPIRTRFQGNCLSAGWMDGGVLHFQTFDGAADFVEMHVRVKDDINLIDSIYDIYYKNTYHPDSSEIQIAHYWFNGDTGRQIHWEVDGFVELKDKRNRAFLVNAQTGEGLTDWNKVECG